MDQGSAQMVVRTERENASNSAVAVFSGGGELAIRVSELLLHQGVKTEWVKSIEEVSMVSEARFLFLFLDPNRIALDGEMFLRRFASLSGRFSAKIVVIFQGVEAVEMEKAEKILRESGGELAVVEIRGKTASELSTDQNREIAGKIVRLGISGRAGERLVFGEFGGKETGFVETTPLKSGVIVSTRTKEKRKMPNLKPLVWGFLFVAIFFLPLAVFGVYASLATNDMVRARNEISSGEFMNGRKSALQARNRFGILKDACVGLSTVGQLDFVCDGLAGLELAADTLVRGANLQGQFMSVSRAFFSPDGEAPDLARFATSASLESQAIEENLGFLEARVGKDYGIIVDLAQKLGISKGQLDKYVGQLPKMRFLARAGKEMAPVTPEVLGTQTIFSQESRKKTYLMVFQNSAELRATGGFIGSYAIIHVDNGRLLDFKINDIYSIDGQLKGRVAPPDEILHYLGQPSWFMRDANFSPDFPLTAKRLAWFLEKETGQQVDGVIGVNIPAVVKILEALGEVNVQSSKEPITAKNFFHKAEYAAEINFFPGSTQKRDFLGEVAEAILGRVVNEKDLSYGQLGLAMSSALEEKDIMFYFNSASAQRAVEESGFSGSIAPSKCNGGQNCLMVVEDNFGANKANYFIKKGLKVNSTLDKAGGIVNKIQMTIENTSPNDSWPGGRYKDYVRFLVPSSAEILSIEVGDARKATISGVLTAEVIAKVKPDQFLAYVSKEQVLTTKDASPSGFKSVGVLVEIPVKSKKNLELEYVIRNQMDFSKDVDSFQLSILKQPGSVFDPLTVTVGFPTFLAPILTESPFGLTPIVYPQELIYNTVLDKDRDFEVKFDQKNAKN